MPEPGVVLGQAPEIGRAPVVPGDQRRPKLLGNRCLRLGKAYRPEVVRDLRAAEEASDLLERPLRRRQADPLRLVTTVLQRGEPLERQRQVRAALGLRDRVDLVDDHPLDAAKALACGRREQQVQRFGRRHQDVRRPAAEGTPLGLDQLTFAFGDIGVSRSIDLSSLNGGEGVRRGNVVAMKETADQAAAINATIERVAYRPLRNAPRVAPLISAIGMSFVLQNIGLVLLGPPRGEAVEAPPVTEENVVVAAWAGPPTIASTTAVVPAVSHRRPMGRS